MFIIINAMCVNKYLNHAIIENEHFRVQNDNGYFDISMCEKIPHFNSSYIFGMLRKSYSIAINRSFQIELI